MIVYADASALVKLFVQEAGSDTLRNVLHAAWAVGTGLLSRAEVGAALARGTRRGLLAQEDALEARQRLDTVWPTWIHVRVDEELVRRAEALGWDYGLRGYDAVHLASALVWQERLEHAVTLATFDRELWTAARSAGMPVWPEQ